MSRPKHLLNRLKWHLANSPQDTVAASMVRLLERGTHDMRDAEFDRHLADLMLEEHDCEECGETDSRKLGFSPHGSVWCERCYGAIGGKIDLPAQNEVDTSGIPRFEERLQEIEHMFDKDTTRYDADPFELLHHWTRLGLQVDRGTVLRTVDKLRARYDELVSTDINLRGAVRRYMDVRCIRALAADLLEASGDNGDPDYSTEEW